MVLVCKYAIYVHVYVHSYPGCRCACIQFWWEWMCVDVNAYVHMIWAS